jgi:hypothetical protein
VVDTIGTHEAQAVDLNGDGLPDLVGHQENTDQIGTDGAVDWWSNDTRHWAGGSRAKGG